MSPPQPANQTNQTFTANLRELQAEKKALESEVFQLKLVNYHLKKKIGQEKRRVSVATPPPDNFYEFETDDTRSDEELNPLQIHDEFKDDNDVINALQQELREEKRLNEQLCEENRQLQEDIAETLRVNDVAVTQLRAKASSEKTRAETMRLQMDAAVAAMEEAQDREEALRTSVSKFQTELQEMKCRLSAVGEQLKTAKRDVQLRTTERDEARQNLKVEMDREDIWNRTSQMMANSARLLDGESPAFEQFISRLDEMRRDYEQRTEYNASWREDVYSYMNECLELLYRLQREVDVKRHLLMNDGSAFTNRVLVAA